MLMAVSYPLPLNLYSAFIQIPKCLEHTSGYVDAELGASRAVISNNHINSSITTLQMYSSAANRVVVCIAVNIRAIVKDLRDGTNVIVGVVPPTA